MKFKFSLDSVLKVRKHQEQIQKQKLAEEVTRKKKIDLIRDEVQSKLAKYLEDELSDQAESIHSIKWRSKHMEQVHKKLEKLQKELNDAEKIVENEREKLAKAYKNLHIMEEIKKIEQKVFNEKAAKSEQKFLDEIAIQSFSR